MKSETMKSETMKSEAMVSKQCVYLFYGHTLYKIDMDRAVPPGPDLLSPILDITSPGMKCALLGSKLYLLGGFRVVKRRESQDPHDFYVFDLLTNSYKKMDALPKAEKPDPSVFFAANGKLYVLGSIPDVRQEELPKMKLFECFDPSTNKWDVLHNLPRVGDDWFLRPHPLGIEWIEEFNVLAKRQQVVLIGREYSRHEKKSARVKFVYDLQRNEWTRSHILSQGETFRLVEGDDDYLYGLSNTGLPIKTKSDSPYFVTKDLFSGRTVADSACLSISDPLLPPEIENENPLRWPEWVHDFFMPSYFSGCARFLHYLGNGHFCCIAAEVYASGEKDARRLNILFFKEIKEGGQQLSFKARTLNFHHYAINAPNEFRTARLIECFVVDSGKLQKKLKKRKDKKKKKSKEVQSIY